MATWKKVIVSGSSAALSALQVDNLLNGVVTGSSNGTLGIQTINGTGNIVATTGATNLSASGSFSGSFSGSLYGVATLPALTQSTGITAFTYSGSAAATIAVSGASTLSSNRISKWTGAAFADTSLTDTGTLVTGSSSIQLTGANSILTGSFSGSFAGALSQPLTFGTGVSGSISSYNGSAAATFAISGSATLSTNVVSKWTGTGLANTNITDTGTQVQVGAGASSGLSVAAGGVNVTGNSTFNSNLTIAGDLTVNGTASFVNSDNLYVKDKFILINSGSGALADSGIVSQYNVAGSGSAIFLESSAAGTYGRWAFAYDVMGNSTSVTADEYVVSAKIGQASGPGVTNPTWGGGTNGTGNMWVTTAGDIYIYS
jgi:hypothetical protein